MSDRLRSYFHEFFVFGLKEAQASIFVGSFFILLFISKYLPLGGLDRYDFLFIAAIVLQIILYYTKIETWDEVKTIFLFHIIGLILEAYKTNPAIASWSYPEEAFFKIGTVPLFSGFMYAAIASYGMQAWRLLKFELEEQPNYALTLVLCAFIYVNFFTNHFIPDFRLVLIPAAFLLFARTTITFVVIKEHRRIPVALGFCLVALFIWIAENFSTFLGAWQYPDQVHVWNVVSTNKITSWFLMVIISFILVAYLKHYKETHRKA